jgi:hypothetical protein
MQGSANGAHIFSAHFARNVGLQLKKAKDLQFPSVPMTSLQVPAFEASCAARDPEMLLH